ncbi:MAG: DMT family transporter [Myxococcaceae bacterium]
MEQSKHVKAELVLLTLTAWWGGTFVVVKDALDDADPVTLLALRFGVAALAGLLMAKGKAFDRTVFVPGLILGTLLFLGYQLQTWGQVYTTPARSAFLTGLMVLLVPFVSPFIVKKWPSPFAFAGVGVASLGLFVMTGASFSGFGLGDVLTILCAVAYAFHIALTEKFAPGRRPFGLLAAQLWPTAVLCALAYPFGPKHLHSTPSLWAAIFALGVLGSALAIGLQMWAQSRTSAVRAALIFATEPVFAAGLSLALGREPYTKALGAGGALIVVGVLVGEVGGAWWGRRQAPAGT